MPASALRTGVPISKRLFDLLVGIPLVILFLPIMGIAALLVWASIGRPLLFRQTRPGFQGQPFELIKFRTMTESFDKAGRALPDSQRITRLGTWMRAFSLDELPEFFNVLRGEMSLIGPRPLLMRYLARYTPEQARRHEVLPGITGWAQVNGRNDLSWEDKFHLDIWYVDHWSLALDLRILGMTFVKVLRREGISQEGYVSSEEFLGEETGDDTRDSLHR